MRMSTRMRWPWPETAEQICVRPKRGVNHFPGSVSNWITRDICEDSKRNVPDCSQWRMTHTQRPAASLEKNQLVCKGALRVKGITNDPLIPRTNNDSHCHSSCARQRGTELDVGHVCSPASIPESTKGLRSVSITLFTCLLYGSLDDNLNPACSSISH